MYKIHTLEEYNKVMDLRRKFGWSSTKIFSFLLKKEIYISKGAIGGWIYRDKKPFEDRLVKKIPLGSKNLTAEKAYILGALCGDGYLSTQHRIGLSACDKDFSEFFKLCLEKVYGLKCSLSIRKRKNPNANLQYVVSLVSKKVVEDLHRYLDSFKTKEWKIPDQIRNSDKEIISFFLRELYDSEGCVRFRRNGWGTVQFYSTNFDGLLSVKELLKNIFNINSKVVHRKYCPILEITYYKDLRRFYRKINFCMFRKQVKLLQLIGSYKRFGLRSYDEKFKIKALELLKDGHSAYQIGKMLKFPYTNVYDFIK